MQVPWLEYIDYDRIKQEQQNNLKSWRLSNYREKKNINLPLPNTSVESADPMERIFRRLTSYDTPLLPPNIVNVAPVIPNIIFSDKDSLFTILEPSFVTLKQFAQYV